MKRLKNSVGIWAFGPNATRFMPEGYHPEAKGETMVERARRAAELPRPRGPPRRASRSVRCARWPARRPAGQHPAPPSLARRLAMSVTLMVCKD